MPPSLLDDPSIQKFLIDLRPAHFSISPIYTATYTGVAVLEMTVNGVAVMRRREDSHFNATQILKVANVDKPLRTKILETRVHTETHEKVQGGYGKYQGTWIAYARAVALAQQLGVYDAIKPLFMYNVGAPEAREVMSKEQAANDASRRVENTSGRVFEAVNSFTLHRDTPVEGALAREASSLTDDDEGSARTKRYRPDTGADTGADVALPNPHAPYTLPPVADTAPSFLHSREQITALFLSDAPAALDADVNCDVPIDDLGHTALHWAATLGRHDLVLWLVARGANRLRGNADGESALVRAVLVTNNHDAGCFPALLDTLHPCITLLDHHGRTLLHHIALTAGIKGRAGALRDYLESLLEWVVRRGLCLSPPLTLGRFMNEVVNVQDKNGDTCLNIAARIGNRVIVQQLLDVGADPSVANKAGLRPTDFGISIAEGAGAARALLTQASAPRPGSEPAAKLFERMTGMLGSLQQEFAAEAAGQQQKLDALHATLRERTRELAQQRLEVEELGAAERELQALRQKISNLDAAIVAEDERFRLQTGDDYARISKFDGEFDADEPFRVPGVYAAVRDALERPPSCGSEADVLAQIDLTGVALPPAALLRARVRAYTKNEALLSQVALDLTAKSAELERKFRHVVALCTGVEEDRVDDLLEGLVAAVENDPEEVDADRVRGLVKKE